jgi:hypothetical protein
MRIADYEPFVSKTVAPGVTPAGIPAMLPVNIPAWDYRKFNYTGDLITSIVYRKGGASGTIVATQTLAYIGDDIDTETITY